MAVDPQAWAAGRLHLPAAFPAEAIQTGLNSVPDLLQGPGERFVTSFDLLRFPAWLIIEQRSFRKPIGMERNCTNHDG